MPGFTCSIGMKFEFVLGSEANAMAASTAVMRIRLKICFIGFSKLTGLAQKVNFRLRPLISAERLITTGCVIGKLLMMITACKSWRQEFLPLALQRQQTNPPPKT